MIKNPCRSCSFHTIYRNRHEHGYSKQCSDCKKLPLHKEYLKTQRKYEVGEPITNIQDLINETWVMWYGRTKHVETFKSMQLRTVLYFLNNGSLKKAVPKQMKKGDSLW